MGGWGETRRDPLSSLECAATAPVCPSSGSRSQSCGAPAVQSGRVLRLRREGLAVWREPEGPENAGVGTRGRAGTHRPWSRPGASTETALGVWPRVPPHPPCFAVLLQPVAVGIPGPEQWRARGLGRRHVTGTPGTHSLAQPLEMGSRGHLQERCNSRVDGVGFRPLPLPPAVPARLCKGRKPSRKCDPPNGDAAGSAIVIVGRVGSMLLTPGGRQDCSVVLVS